MSKTRLTRDEINQIANVIDELGEAGAADEFLVNPATLLRGLASRPLLASTAQCLRSRLRELSAARGVRS